MVNFAFVLSILLGVVSSTDTMEAILNTLNVMEKTQNQLKTEIDNLKTDNEKKDIVIRSLIANDKGNQARNQNT